MLRNQAQALLRHERIETTVPKAKELRPFVERLITVAKRSVAAEPGGATPGAAAGPARAAPGAARHPGPRRRRASCSRRSRPRFAGRPGGYTRLLRLGYRRGDAAEIAQIELVGSEFNPKKAAEAEAKAAEAREGQGRRRAAASGCRAHPRQKKGGGGIG